MGRNEPGAEDDADLLDAADDGELVMGERRGDRVVVAIEPHKGERVRPGGHHPAGLEGSGRDPEHRRSVLVTGLPRTRRTRSARQEASSEAFSSANEEQEGTGTMKLRRPYPTSDSTWPFSLPRPTRQKWWVNRKWLSRRRNSRVRARSRPITLRTAIVVLS